MKIFGIGYNKTGTTSLKEALETLGYRTSHNSVFSEEITNLAEKGKKHPGLEQFDAVLDFPDPTQFRKLDELYPGSKFILTLRDVHDWINSRLAHVLMNRRVESRESGWVNIDTWADKKMWEAHVKDVKTYFKDRHKDLLEYQICEGQKWGPLCTFLGKDRPSVEFPVLNTMMDRKFLIGQLNSNPEFTTNWVTSHIPAWTEILKDFLGKPNLRMLEIGCYEGRSTLWWLNNLLTHHGSSLLCIDCWTNPPVENRFDMNLAASGLSHKVQKIKSHSWRLFPWLLEHYAGKKFHVIYVDGSHEAVDVIADAVFCLRMLEAGGIMIFDDYKWEGRRHHMPKPAIDAFLEMCDFEVEIIHKGYQLAVRKRDKPIPLPAT